MALLFVILFSAMLRAATRVESSPTSTNASLHWGPYRPNLYLGLRPREANSLLMGLMWAVGDDTSTILSSEWLAESEPDEALFILIKSWLSDLRHTCEQDEGMAGYGWETYDVRTGGKQVINDTGNSIDIITKFAKANNEEGGSWGLRIEAAPRTDAPQGQKTSLVFYMGNEDQNSQTQCREQHRHESLEDGVFCNGTARGLGLFKLQIPRYSVGNHEMSISSLTVSRDALWEAKRIYAEQVNEKNLHEGSFPQGAGNGNLHFVQIGLIGRSSVDILFSSSKQEAMTSTALTVTLQEAEYTFGKRFESVYAPQAPFQDDASYRSFSQSLLSNLLGGIGYFHGTSKVDASSAPEYAETDQDFSVKAASAQSRANVEEHGPHKLFTAVPSRPFFPRGFLWDEGFHLQVILDWDVDLALDIVSSWFKTMDNDGWIAREQILGPEARSKVPPQFQIQYTHYANPPTLFTVVQSYVEILHGDKPYSGVPSVYLNEKEKSQAFLETIYAKMKTHYDWFCRTQAGNLTSYRRSGVESNQGYRWRGRTTQHVLTSGLDDYPRAQPPHPEELHLDALCWVGLMAASLDKISTYLGDEKGQKQFSARAHDVVQSIDAIHWSELHRAYCDTTIVNGDQIEKVCHKGYISLFPFILGLMSPDHLHLGSILDIIRSREHLWSPFGLRSLSTRDKYYGTDENYWRSPIWININYMALQQLLVSIAPFYIPLIQYRKQAEVDAAYRNSPSMKARTRAERGRYTAICG